MAELGTLARLIRSKNAGPFDLTFDIMFDGRENYERVVRSGALSASIFAEMYRVPVETVRFFEHDAALAIKISIPRPYGQCDAGDGDCYGGQQYGPLVTLEIE
ncbi:DUF4387 domain-containing protein [Ensifer sp. YR511]|uniref:DUF4387 domain-containing protein n=1 Tax=Ensifer sp. YR511 TaxID=1855294 RepID=UPI000882E814|nr:DUF4387 domain-containing protein [Ensifer sp. YR511]SDN73408.1 protein of unknown function [Ensifer sp. YR511]